MAELVGAAMKRVMHPTQWRRFESGDSEPSLEIIRAAARVSELSPAYIAFGAEDDLAVGARKLTDEELDRADAKAAQEEAKRSGRTGDRKDAGRRRA